MNRTEFVIATAIILFLFFCLGWFACWLMHRLTRVTRADMGELETMAQALHEAEEARAETETYIAKREAQLTNQISQGEAELKAAMEALREARREAEELRSDLRKHKNG